jgi:AcrR family transcriptional regulator
MNRSGSLRLSGSLPERFAPVGSYYVPVVIRRGRQAEAERNDRLVLNAARAVVARYGPDASVAAIADLAGVGIGSLYRRYGSKADLLRQLCTLAMQDTILAAEDGLAEADPWTGLAGYIQACVAQRTGSLGALAGSIETTPEMWAISQRSRALLDKLVKRASRAGVLRPDVTALDIAWLIEALGRSGPAEPSPPDEIIKRRLTAIAIDGLRGDAAGEPPSALAGPSPTARHYEQRWQRPDSNEGLR